MKVDEAVIDEVIAGLSARVDTELSAAKGFPNEAYTSQEFFERERRHLFPNTWVLAGFRHDIPEPGDVMPVEIGGSPIVLLRNQRGEIAAFHNACRHRGAAVVNQPCSKQARLVCPYHAWTYDLDGKLIGRPYFAGTKQGDQQLPAAPEFNLQQVRCETWIDMVFVNLSNDAPPLSEFLQPMVDKLGGYDLGALGYAGKLEFEINANWKFAGENFIEQYHVFRAHPGLVKFSPMNDREPGEWEDFCFSTYYQFPALEAGRGAELPHFPNLSDVLQRRGIWFYVYPNLGIEIFPDQLIVFRVIPVAPDKTREEIHVYLMKEAASGEQYSDARQNVFDTWHDLNMEDVGLLEVLQKGRTSPSYDGGVFSEQWEKPTADYSRLIARGLQNSVL